VAKENIKESLKSVSTTGWGWWPFSAPAYTNARSRSDHTVLDGVPGSSGSRADRRRHRHRHGGWQPRLPASASRPRRQGDCTADRRRQQPRRNLAAGSRRRRQANWASRFTPSAWAKEGEVPYPVPVHRSLHEQGGAQRRFRWYSLPSTKPLSWKLQTQPKAGFFRAQDAQSLKEIYGSIDKMEKTEIKTKSYTTYSEKFSHGFCPVPCCCLSNWCWRIRGFRRIP